MTKELVALRDRHMSKKHASIPQVFYNNMYMSLNALDENPDSLFSRLQYRLCRLPSLQQINPPFCNETYRSTVESLVLLVLAPHP